MVPNRATHHICAFKTIMKLLFCIGYNDKVYFLKDGLIRLLSGCIAIGMVLCVPVYVIKGGDKKHPDVIPVIGGYKNMSNIIRHLNNAIPTPSASNNSKMNNFFASKIQSSIPCPSGPVVTYNNNDSYEIQYDVNNDKKIVSFKRMPLYREQRCLSENQSCCSQAATKCKTYKEQKIIVRLNVKNNHVSFVDGKDNVKSVPVGRYCKCDKVSNNI